jgi:hypothetical protein
MIHRRKVVGALAGDLAILRSIAEAQPVAKGVPCRLIQDARSNKLGRYAWNPFRGGGFHSPYWVIPMLWEAPRWAQPREWRRRIVLINSTVRRNSVAISPTPTETMLARA